MLKKSNNKSSIKIILLLSLLTLIASITLISAAGVATSYWDDNPLKLAPGESEIISLRLQSSETEDITLRATLSSNIATLVNGPDYLVPVGATEVPVSIKVSIPKNAEIGTRYNIQVSFQQISSEEGGMLQVAQGITSKLPVEVVGQAESELYGKPTFWSQNLAWIILAGLVFVAVSFFLIRNRKTKRKN